MIKAIHPNELDDEFDGDPLLLLARAYLPDQLANLQGLALVAGYNIQISSRLLDDGGLLYQVVVNRATADGDNQGDCFIG